MRSSFVCVGILAGLAALTGCDGSGTNSGGSGSAALTITSSATKLAPGQTITLTATEMQNSKAEGSGTVSFLSNGKQIATAKMSNGSASVSVSYSELGGAGANSVTAQLPVTGSSALSAGPLTVNCQAVSATVLRLSNDSVQQGRGTTLEAQVQRQGLSGTATGSVTFFSGTQQVGSAQVNGAGIAYYALPAFSTTGLQSFTAQYAGDDLDVASTSSAATVTVTPGVDVLTYHTNITRDGVQTHESKLTTANVNADTFGLLRSFPLDGISYSTPLYVSQYTMSDGAAHNVVFAATALGSVYAFDADGNNPAQGYLWKQSLVPAGEAPAMGADVGCADAPQMSITGTPVIDRARGVIYVVVNTTSNSATQFTHRLHALKLADGSEQMHGPSVIAASFPGHASDAVNGTLTFTSKMQNQRAALLEAEGSVWLAFASHCDFEPYHGWVLGYDVDDVTRQTAAYVDTPNSTEGGIWMSGGGPSADSMGNIYVVAGNGNFDNDADDHGNSDLADAAIKLAVPFGAPTNGGLTVADFFSPSNQSNLQTDDWDMGTADALLINAPGSSTPNLLATGDKTGQVYLLNRDNMGKYQTGTNGLNGLNGDLSDFSGNGWLFSEFTYFNGQIYIGVNGQPLASYPLNTPAGSAANVGGVTQGTSVSFPFAWASGGTHPVISTNGSGDAVAWAVSMSGQQQLVAFDANHLANTLYANVVNPARDTMGGGQKFQQAVVADGHVFVVSAKPALHVFGLITTP